MTILSLAERVWRLVRRRLSFLFPVEIDDSARRFIAFARAHWVQDYPTKPGTVFLVGLAPWRPAMFCQAYVANHLARKAGAMIEAFHFSGAVNRAHEAIYASFGAKLGLRLPTDRARRAAAQKRAREIFRGLRTKQDVLEISVDGVVLGDLIYDSYLRYLGESTIDIGDGRLEEMITEALLIFSETQDYLRRKNVKGFIADDYSYLNTGIPTRLAGLAGIPVYIVLFGPDFYVFQLEYASARHNVPCVPYYRFKDTFLEFGAAARDLAREKGRAILSERLSGSLDGKTLQTISAYGDSFGEPIFEQTRRPRIMVMLHDFIDAPHSYRWILFPDFFEWICFLLERAQQTDFDWYVKPHPSSGEKWRREIARINAETLEVLKSRFPKIRFLEPNTSNRQILDEGVDALFTVHGTAAHEFAYMGIPVVNAGDNPHCQYDFNLHARSREEYESYIANADHLEVSIDRAEIEEFCYMNYFYCTDQYSSGANPMDPAIFQSPESLAEMNGPRAFDLYMAGASPERERKLNSYLDGFPRKPFSIEQTTEWAGADVDRSSASSGARH